MSRPKYFIKTTVKVYGGRTKYEVVKGFSDADSIAKVGSERDATRLCEEFERLTEDYAALLAATQWRPIETAPKDGTEVLLFSSSEFYYVGKYCYEKDGETVWACGSFMLYGPTHWMSLPKPPCV